MLIGAPCQAMSPVVDSLARDGYAVERVNIDRNRDLAVRYGVTSVPCFVVVEQGKEVDRIVGQTSIERLKAKMKRRGLRVERGNQPHPAWRYERAVGHRAAVVRIHCHDGGSHWSTGSGVLVRWGRRIVVLTARHVVQDAHTIYVDFFDGKRRRAKVLKVDRKWDCAVLDVGLPPEGIQPAEMAFGAEAKFQEGDRLESCGYGPDGKLACNSGLFEGYRRSSAAAQGPDDWMVISGHARGGDSGGPVFDKQGRVVGILWGTDGKEVVCVQPGRLHELLNEAVVQTYEQKQYAERRPTPPQTAPLVPLTAAEQAKLAQDKRPLLPWRGDAEKHDAEQDARIERLIDLAERQQAARAVPAQSADVSLKRPATPRSAGGRSPLLAGLCLLGGIAVGFVVYFGGKKN